MKPKQLIGKTVWYKSEVANPSGTVIKAAGGKAVKVRTIGVHFPSGFGDDTKAYSQPTVETWPLSRISLTNPIGE